MIIMVMMTTFMAIIVRTLKRDVDRIRVWRALELIQHLPASNGAIGRSKGKFWLCSGFFKQGYFGCMIYCSIWFNIICSWVPRCFQMWTFSFYSILRVSSLKVLNPLILANSEIEAHIRLFTQTRSYATLWAAGLDWIVGPGYIWGRYIPGCSQSLASCLRLSAQIWPDLLYDWKWWFFVTDRDPIWLKVMIFCHWRGVPNDWKWWFFVTDWPFICLEFSCWVRFLSHICRICLSWTQSRRSLWSWQSPHQDSTSSAIVEENYYHDSTISLSGLH